MCELNTDQKLDLTQQLAQAFSYEDEDRGYPEDVAHEVVDSWLPVYYYDILQAWIDAGNPNVEDRGLLAEEKLGDVYHVMQVALYEQGLAWVSHLFWNYSEEDVRTAGQALTACNTYLAVRGANTYLRNGKRAGKVVTL